MPFVRLPLRINITAAGIQIIVDPMAGTKAKRKIKKPQNRDEGTPRMENITPPARPWRKAVVTFPTTMALIVSSIFFRTLSLYEVLIGRRSRMVFLISTPLSRK